jgi:recombinational DNA repair protein (RecF pathway)
MSSREHGKFAAIAKGARKAKTRDGSALDLFSRSRMMLAKGRNLDFIRSIR